MLNYKKMEETIESSNKDSKGENMIGSVGNFDDSQMKKRKLIRIIILVSIILVLIAIGLILFFCLRSSDDGNKEIKCLTGPNENCLSCEEGTTNVCTKCNPFFSLNNGKCSFIYSFEAIYKSNVEKEKINFFNTNSLNNFEINKIKIDDKYLEDKINEYTFPKAGEHKVLINIKLNDTSSSLEKMFENIEHLVSIKFTNHFNDVLLNINEKENNIESTAGLF